MKKKTLIPFLAFLAAATVAPMAACSNSNNNNNDESATSKPVESQETSVDETAEYQEMVDAALAALKVEESYTADFTLTTKGAGNVAIAWTSDNEAITVNGAEAKVTRPGFGKEDVTVTLTATAAFQGVVGTKTFTVKLAALQDESTKISAIKELADEKEIYCRGVVTGFLYGCPTNGTEESRYGFYLTDETGTIYVYGSQTAKLVEDNQEVYFKAKVGSFSGVKQVTSPSELTVIKSDAEVEYNATVLADDAAMQAAYNKYIAKELVGGEVYEMLAMVYVNSYGGYSLEALSYDNTTVTAAFGLYFSGSAQASFENFKADVVGKNYVRVIFYVNSVNGSQKPRGNILAVLPFTDADKEALIEKELAANVKVDQFITENPAIKLPTTIAGYDGYTIEWSLNEQSVATITDGVLNVTPTATATAITLTYKIMKGETEFKTGSYTANVCTSFEAKSFAEFKAAAVNDSVLVGGIVTKVYTGKGVFIRDAEGYGYYIYDKNVAAAVAEGNNIVVFGTKATYNGEIQISKATVVTNDKATTAATPVDITDEIKTNGLGTAVEVQNRYVTFKGTYIGNKKVKVGENEVALFLIGDASLDGLAEGAIVQVTGCTYVNNTANVNIFTSPVDVTTPQDKVELALDAIKAAIGTDVLQSVVEIDLTAVPFASDVTITVATSEGAKTIAYDATAKKITITPVDGETTETLTVTVVCGEATTGAVDITVKAKYDAYEASKKTATLAFTGSTNTTAAALVTAGTLTTSLGLSADDFTVTYAKNKGSSELAVRTDGLRLYGKAGEAKGNQITVALKDTTKEILTINIAFDTGYSACAVVYGADGTTVLTPNEDGTYTINGGSFSILSDNTDLTSNTQVRFKSIEILYAPKKAAAEDKTVISANATYNMGALCTTTVENTTATYGDNNEIVVDATTGKLAPNGDNVWAQFNNTTTITFKVKAGATVSVTCYTTKFTVNGVASTAAAQTAFTQTFAADTTVVIASTENNNYIGNIVISYGA